MSLQADVRVQLGTLDLEVALHAEAGRVLAVLGPNGAGKTTLVRALVGLIALDAGAIVLGDDVLDDPERRIFVAPEHRRTGYLPQGLGLFPHLRVIDNVAFGPRSAGAGRTASRRIAER